MRLMRNLMNALLLGAAASSLAVAADRDGEYRLNELQSTDAGYRKAWQNLVEDESRLPDWVMNLSGTATPMHAVDDQGDKYLVGGLARSPIARASACWSPSIGTRVMPTGSTCRCPKGCRRTSRRASTPAFAGWASRNRRYRRSSTNNSRPIRTGTEAERACVTPPRPQRGMARGPGCAG